MVVETHENENNISLVIEKTVPVQQYSQQSYETCTKILIAVRNL